MRELLTELANSFRSQVCSCQLQFDLDCDERSLPVKANRVAFAEALHSLVQNAISACEVGGTVAILVDELIQKIQSASLPKHCRKLESQSPMMGLV